MSTKIIQHFYYDSIDSTNKESKRLIDSGKIKDIAVVVANYQTKGRGTHGRKWDSPNNAGIYLSVVHLPKENKFFETTTLYTLACGIACVESINEICKIKPSLKPVNDIYFDGKKLGGILVESKLHNSGISSLITGIGINVQKTKYDLDRDVIKPVSLEEILTSESYKSFSKEKLIKTIVNKVDFWYSFIFNGEHLKIQNKWNDFVLKN